MQSIFFAKDKAGNEVSIFDVNSGLACSCTCIDCGKPLIAHKGQVKAWHFQHESYKGCNSAEETSLHKLSKIALASMPDLTLPSVSYIFKDNKVELNSEEVFTIKEIDTEVVVSGVGKPDLVLKNDTECVYIEFCVTHKSTGKKIKAYRAKNCKALEIKLSDKVFEGCRNLGELLSALKNCLISRDYSYKWLSHPSLNELLNLLEDKGVSFYNASGLTRFICPNRTMIVGVDDCKSCPYNILYSKKEVRCRGNLSKDQLLKIAPNTVFPPTKLNYVGCCTSCFSSNTDLENSVDGLVKVCKDCNTIVPQVCPICGSSLKKMVNNNHRYGSYKHEFLGCNSCSFTLTFRKPNGDFADEMIVTGGLDAISKNKDIYNKELYSYRRARKR